MIYLLTGTPLGIVLVLIAFAIAFIAIPKSYMLAHQKAERLAASIHTKYIGSRLTAWDVILVPLALIGASFAAFFGSLIYACLTFWDFVWKEKRP